MGRRRHGGLFRGRQACGGVRMRRHVEVPSGQYAPQPQALRDRSPMASVSTPPATFSGARVVHTAVKKGLSVICEYSDPGLALLPAVICFASWC
jgi:hypothetical protein